MSKISIESKPVVLGFRHLYLVHENDQDEEFVIRGGPENDNPLNFGEIINEVNVPIDESEDARGNDTPEDRGRRELDLGGRLADNVWDIMKQQATNINSAILNYSTLNSHQNSNSTIASVLNSVGIEVSSNLPTNTQVNDFPGVDNFLKINTTLIGKPVYDIIWGYEGIDNLSSKEGDDRITVTVY